MRKGELRMRIARLKKEKKEEEERKKLRGMEREAIAETREAKRERRISGIRLGVEKAKVYKALPFPHLRPRDEEETLRREEKRAEKEEVITERKAALTTRQTKLREAKKARLLSERELRKERLRPYTEAATKVAKGLGKTAFELVKIPFKGLEYLGKESRKYERKHPKGEPPLDLTVDLGFGQPSKGRKRKSPKEPPIKIL